MKVMTRFLILGWCLLWPTLATSAPGVNVVYPDWFKQSLYDLPGDLQDARASGKQGIMVFFTEKHCSYCHAMIENTLTEKDIVQRLRQHYDVIGMDVTSDVEVIDPQGKNHWAKDYAVQAKAIFTPTLVFYGLDGQVQLRLVGFQAPQKMRNALDYLEGGHYARMSLSSFMQTNQTATDRSSEKSTAINLDHRKSDKPLLVVFETEDCEKCPLLRTMLKAEVMHPYSERLNIVFINSSSTQANITTPDNKVMSGKTWAEQLGLINSPAMVFFDAQGKVVLQVDTDILIDKMGKPVTADNARIQDNVRARLQFVVDKGYIELPQFQRWRARQSRQEP